MSTSAGVELRPVADSDLPFLRRLYATSRAAELELTGWDSEQRDAFLDMQFGARERSYREQLPARLDRVILVDGQVAGRFCVDRSADEIRVVDIALLPEYQGAGVGSALLTGLQREAALANVAVVLQVATGNHAAASLYRRLGFVASAADGLYAEMRWQPEDVGAGAPR